MSKYIKKIVTALWATLLVAMFVLLLAFGLTQMPPVRRWAARSVSSSLSQSLGLPVSVGSLRYFPFTTVEISDVCISDADSLPMISVTRAKADVDLSILFGDVATLNVVEADSMEVNVRQREDGGLNIYDLSSGGDAPMSEVFIGVVKARHCIVSYSALGREAVDFKNFSLDVGSLRVGGAGVGAYVSDVSFDEPGSGARLSAGGRVVAMGDTLALASGRLSLGGCVMKVDSIGAVVDSTGVRSAVADVPSMRFTGEIMSRMLGWSVPQFGFAVRASLLGDDVRVDYLRASLGESSNVSASGSVRLKRPLGADCVDLANVSFSGWLKPADVAMLLGYPDGYGAYPAFPFDGSASLKQGQASANVNVNSAFGRVNAYADASTSDGWALADFSLQVAADLLPSKLTDGSVTRVEAKVKADGRLNIMPEKNQYQTDELLRYVLFSGSVDRLDAMGLSVGGIDYDGTFSSDGLYGRIGMADPIGLLTLYFESKLDGVTPYVSLTMAADSLQMDALSPSVFKSPYRLGLRSRFETQGLDPRSAKADFQIQDLYLRSDTDTVSIPHLEASLGYNDDGLRILSISSDMINATASGNFDVGGLTRELQCQLHSALPSLVPAPKSASKRAAANAPTQTADFDVVLSGADRFVKIFVPSLSLPDSVSFRGSVDSESHFSWARLRTPRVAFGSVSVDSLGASFVSNDGNMSLTLRSSSLSAPFVGVVKNMAVDSDVSDDAATVDFAWGGKRRKMLWNDRIAVRDGSVEEGGYLSLDAVVERDAASSLPLCRIGIDRSRLPIGESLWTLDTCRFVLAHDYVSVGSFNASSGEHSISARGTASSNEGDTIRLWLNKIVLEDVLKTDENSKYSLAGDLSLMAEASAIYAHGSVGVSAYVDRLVVDGDNLEHMDLSASYGAGRDSVELGVSIVTGGVPRAFGNGYCDLKNQSLYLPLTIDSLSTGFLNFYLDNCIDQWRGTTSGWLTLHGPLSDIALDSHLNMNEGNSFRVMQTDVRYTLVGNDSLVLSPTIMDFRKIRFADDNGKRGVFDGYIKHSMFSDLDMGLDFTVDNMLLLSTTAKESPSYYGTVYGSGLMRITGPTSNVDIFIEAKTDKGSTFTVDPNAKTDVVSADFIHDGDEAAKQSLVKSLGTGTTATLKLRVTPDAKLSVVIGEQLGKLTGTGHGDLNIGIGRVGELTMHGGYTIDNGEYDLSFGVFDKQFTIDNGGTLSWNGGPYDVMLDLAATYQVRASIYSLVSGTSYANNADLKKRVPINCKIYLNGRLTKPDIRFGIVIPSSQNFNQYAFDQYVNTQDEVSRQVFSLLASGQFYAVQDASSQSNQSQSYLSSAASELFSNKISSLISQNDKNIGVGVNYRPGDEMTNEEYELSMSTQVFDNKVLLSGNIGYGRDATNTASDGGSLIGDFDVEVKLNKKGNIRAKAYTHSNNDVIYETSPTTQGIGLSYQEEFDSFIDLFKSYWRKIFRRRGEKSKLRQKQEGDVPKSMPVEADSLSVGNERREDVSDSLSADSAAVSQMVRLK